MGQTQNHQKKSEKKNIFMFVDSKLKLDDKL